MTTIPYVVGIIHAVVCTSDTDEEATKMLNLLHPTNISSDWSIAEDLFFDDGQSNPCPCNKDLSKRHILFHC